MFKSTGGPLRRYAVVPGVPTPPGRSSSLRHRRNPLALSLGVARRSYGPFRRRYSAPNRRLGYAQGPKPSHYAKSSVRPPAIAGLRTWIPTSPGAPFMVSR